MNLQEFLKELPKNWRVEDYGSYWRIYNPNKQLEFSIELDRRGGILFLNTRVKSNLQNIVYKKDNFEKVLFLSDAFENILRKI